MRKNPLLSLFQDRCIELLKGNIYFNHASDIDYILCFMNRMIENNKRQP